MVKAQGIKPIQTSDDDEGRFATFKDPEGNLVSIWGK
jgi:predicted enzyme related to lactoylglutathione lyase